MQLFEDIVYLFNCGQESRGIVRLDLDEASMLYKYVKKTKGNVVEIGRKYGGSAILIASAMDGDRKLHSIDIVSYPQLQQNLDKTSQETVDRIDVIVGESTEIAKQWTEEVSLVFVDGDHAYDSVQNDVNSWGKFVEPGGFMALHDVRDTFLGLEPIIDELKENGWEEVDCVDTLIVLKKMK